VCVCVCVCYPVYEGSRVFDNNQSSHILQVRMWLTVRFFTHISY